MLPRRSLALLASFGTLALPLAIALCPAAARADDAKDARPKPAAPAQKPAPQPRKAEPATVLPAVIDDGTRRRPTAAESDTAALLAKLDELLADTARDLGLSLDGPRALLPDPTTVTDQEMFQLARSTGGVVIAATARVDGNEIELRLSLASPSRRALQTRTERFARDDLAVRAVVMLRDVVTDAGAVAKPAAPSPKAAAVQGQMATAARSEGRAILAANATVFGGLLGFSVERASGSSDPRLLYPLLAVGAGVGLGASLLIADEWDVGTGDAWFLSSGGIWPTAAAHLIYEGRFGNASGHPGPEGDRWAFGLVGGSLGLTLSTLSLALGDMESGGALLAHSGGAFGLALGGLTEWFVRGTTNEAPFAGMGYGAAFGWLAAAGVATTRVHVAPLRVLSMDLGAVLGGLLGAALGSPLVVQGPNSTQTRGWIACIGTGVLFGAGGALWLTRGGAGPAKADLAPEVRVAGGLTVRPDLPDVGILAESALGASAAPPLGVRFRGRW
jgi:hypothetical protein